MSDRTLPAAAAQPRAAADLEKAAHAPALPQLAATAAAAAPDAYRGAFEPSPPPLLRPATADPEKGAFEPSPSLPPPLASLAPPARHASSHVWRVLVSLRPPRPRAPC